MCRTYKARRDPDALRVSHISRNRKRRERAVLVVDGSGRATREEYAAWRGCKSKSRFATDVEAYAAALRCSRDIGPMRVYACDRCGGYHLTTDVEVYGAAS